MSIEIKNITEKLKGRVIDIIGKIERKADLLNPQIITVGDGTASIDAVSFKSLFSKFKPGDVVRMTGKIKTNKGILEMEAFNIEKGNSKDHAKIIKRINEEIKKKSKIEQVENIVNTDKIKAMNPEFERCAVEIRKSIAQGEPVLIRHHYDCDGYCAGIALERAILPLIEKTHRNKSQIWKFFRQQLAG